MHGVEVKLRLKTTENVFIFLFYGRKGEITVLIGIVAAIVARSRTKFYFWQRLRDIA
jgi:hypothetical protein